MGILAVLLCSGMAAASVAVDYTPSYAFAPNSVHMEIENGGQVFTCNDSAGYALFTGVSPSFTYLNFSQYLGFSIYNMVIPNFVDDLPTKYMRVQMFWDSMTSSETPAVQTIGYDSTGDVNEVLAFTSKVDYVNNIYSQYVDWKLSPNPDWEQVLIVVPAALTLQKIVIDTVSVPVPATLLIFGSGLIALLGFRKKTSV